jgi:hypothetical protein
VTATAAIVGTAWRTPLGHDLVDVLNRMLAGEDAARPLTRIPAATYQLQRAATVEREPARSKHARFLRRMALHAMDAAGEALATAAQRDVVPGPRMGLYAAVGGLRAHWDDIMAALVRQQDDGADAWARGLGQIHPFWMLRHLSNNTHALIATDTGARGDGATFGGATAGAQALAAAARALAAGAVDAALVIAYDTLLEPETLVELGAREGERAVPGEAAAAMVLVAADDPRGAGRRRLAAATAADGSRGRPADRTVAAAVARLTDPARRCDDAIVDVEATQGQLGAATSVVQAIALDLLVGIPGRPVCRIATATGAPGLAAAVRVGRP